jgi:hypothetical protein
VLSVKDTFRRDKDALLHLQELLSSGWFEKAVQSALLIQHESAKTVDEIIGAQDFIRCLAGLTETDPLKPEPITSGLDHDIESYAKRTRGRTKPAHSDNPAAATGE